MSKLWSWIVIISAHFVALPEGERRWVLFQLSIDMVLLSFFAGAVFVGFTKDFNAFYFLVPFLAFVVWSRIKQMKARLKL